MKLKLILSFLLFSILLSAQDIPQRPEPARLVNDLAGILDPSYVQYLEQKLIVFDDSTSNQIVVVTVPSLNGYDVQQVAFAIGEKWGVGQKGKNNGIVILIKPKKGNEKGQVRIEVGYGLEGVVPDAIANRIIDNEMIPYFKQNDYNRGVEAAVNTLISLTKGEYTADQYSKKKKKKKESLIPFLIIAGLFFIFFVFGNKRKDRHNNIGGAAAASLPWWLLLGMGNNSGGGSYGGFSSGGGSFGGFGGGSFGGGGSSGSW